MGEPILYTREIANQLHEFVGDGVKVYSALIDYQWDCIILQKGDKQVRIFTRNLMQIMRPDGISEYVETIPN
jgi:hypothetical protein